jgi:hypothetical protein
VFLFLSRSNLHLHLSNSDSKRRGDVYDGLHSTQSASVGELGSMGDKRGIELGSVGVKRGSSRDVTAPCWESRRYVPRPRHESGLGRCRKRGGRRDLSVGVGVALPVNLHSQGSHTKQSWNRQMLFPARHVSRSFGYKLCSRRQVNRVFTWLASSMRECSIVFESSV